MSGLVEIPQEVTTIRGILMAATTVLPLGIRVSRAMLSVPLRQTHR
jgi:hypothetical protein